MKIELKFYDEYSPFFLLTTLRKFSIDNRLHDISFWDLVIKKSYWVNWKLVAYDINKL